MADTRTLHGLDGTLAALKSLPEEIVSKRGGPVKTALRKGAVVIQKEAQRQVRAIVRKPDPDHYVSTDLLAQSIAVRRDPNPQRSGANERYRVLISRSKKYVYPETLREKHQIKTIMTARYLEFGTEQRAPTPWMAPAFFAAREQALSTVVYELNQGIDRVIRRLSKTGQA